MIVIIIFLLTIFVFIASRYYPVFTFWFLINLYFDPGGYQIAWFQNNIVSIINFTDIIFLLCWIPYFNINSKINIIQHDKYFYLFYRFLTIYMLYFVCVYGYIVPQINGRADFVNFLIKSRLYFMAFLLIKPIYFFIKSGIEVYLKIVIYTAVICLTLYLISLLSGLNLIPIATVDRYIDSGITRITLWSYGLFDWVLNIAIIVLVLKIRIKNRKLLFYSGLLMAFSIVLTLTRRELIGRVFNLAIIVLVINHLFKGNKRVQITKILFPLVFLFCLLLFTFPEYIRYSNDEYKSIVSLAKTGKDKEGNIDYRFAGTGDVVTMKELILNNLFFGVGFTRYSLDDFSNLRRIKDPLAGLYAGGELPYLGSIGKMGIFGLMVFLPMYLLILWMSLLLFNVIKQGKKDLFLRNNYYELIFAVFSLTFVINKFTFSLFNIFVETNNPSSFLLFSIILCLIITCYNNLKKTMELETIDVQNNSKIDFPQQT